MVAHKEPRSNKYPQLTRRQELVYDFICKFLKEHPYPPTVREIQRHLKVKSTSTVYYALNGLTNAGFITKSGGKMRAIELIEKDTAPKAEILPTPVVGNIAAGEPILAEQNINDYYPLPAALYSSTNRLFILRVKGESMKNVGILDNDFVIIEQCDTADNGDIVAALLGDSATIKRFFKEEDYIRLQPENEAMEPIIVKDGLLILGKVIGLYRNQIN